MRKPERYPEIRLLGASGNALEIIDGIHAKDPDVTVVVHDDEGRYDGKMVNLGGHLLQYGGKINARCCALAPENAFFLLTVGSPRDYRDRRKDIIKRLDLDDRRWWIYQDPQAVVRSSAEVSLGAIIMAGAYVGAKTHIGTHVILLPQSYVAHGAWARCRSILASGAKLNGGSIVGMDCYVGANAVIREGVLIGDGSIIGAGAVVLNEVPPDSVVVGVPGVVTPREEWDAKKRFVEITDTLGSDTRHPNERQ